MVGAGNIGQAIANYASFERLGIELVAIFDVNPKVIGTKIRDIEIDAESNLKEYLKNNDIAIGIICVPKMNAQRVCDELVSGGIKGIWNFAPVDLSVPDDVKVENVHLSESLSTLIYLLHTRE